MRRSIRGVAHPSEGCSLGSLTFRCFKSWIRQGLPPTNPSDLERGRRETRDLAASEPYCIATEGSHPFPASPRPSHDHDESRVSTIT